MQNIIFFCLCVDVDKRYGGDDYDKMYEDLTPLTILKI